MTRHSFRHPDGYAACADDDDDDDDCCCADDDDGWTTARPCHAIWNAMPPSVPIGRWMRRGPGWFCPPRPMVRWIPCWGCCHSRCRDDRDEDDHEDDATNFVCFRPPWICEIRIWPVRWRCCSRRRRRWWESDEPGGGSCPDDSRPGGVPKVGRRRDLDVRMRKRVWEPRLDDWICSFPWW